MMTIEFSFLNIFVEGCYLECIVEVDLPVKILVSTVTNE